MNGIVVGAVVLLVYVLGLFRDLRLRAPDALFVDTSVSDSVVLVAIDDASLAAYGRSPAEWSRALHAVAVERLAAAGARVIAFELLMPEATVADRILSDAIESARTTGERTRFVFAAAGVGAPRAAVTPAGVRAIKFQTQLVPTQVLADVTDYIGDTSIVADPDGVVRHQSTFTIINGQLHPSFSVAAYLAYLRIPAADFEQVLRAEGDSLFITADRQVAVDSFGQWRQNFQNEPGAGFPIISFRDLIDADPDLSSVRDKVVIVGLLNATGATDTFWSPVTRNSHEMAGVEILAQAIDSLIGNTALAAQSPPPVMAMILVLAFGSALVYEHMRTFLKPVAIVGLVLLFAFIVSYVFARDRIIVDVFDGLLALVAPGVLSIGMAVRRQYNRRQTAEMTAHNLNREKQRLEKLRFGLPVSVAILDPKGQVLRTNQAFDALLSPLAQRSVWAHFAARLGQSGLDDETAKKLQMSLDGGKRYAGEISLESKTYNLTTTWFEDLQQWVVVLADVTTLAELNQIKRQMLLMISHDLRNPLSSVNVQVHHLRKLALGGNQDATKPIDNIEKASRLMQAILNDVIDLEQIRSLEFPRTAVDMSKVIRDIADRYRDDCNAKGQTLTLDLEADAPPVYAHEGQISQVVANLVSNAVKYTPDKGTITVRLYSESPTVVRIAVQDTGIGIPAEEQSKLFAEFYRVRTRATSDIAGTGLGLSIVKSVVDRHGGRVWFESVEGQGTTFYVELPALMAETVAN
ncbi:MAG: CHASE2 domain-containing protein [Anaerolineae bacterium]|nr:CHASE2 domain-containing protein [Anaerolineae bacterium]